MPAEIALLAALALSASRSACPTLPARGPAGLPAPVTVTSTRRNPCGAVRLLPDGRVVRVPWRPSFAAPAGTVMSFPLTDPSLIVTRRAGRLVLVREGRVVWRSRDRYRLLRTPCQLIGVAVGRAHVAFSFSDVVTADRGVCSRLLVAPLSGGENVVPGATGERPIGWVGGERLVTARYQGGSSRLALRSSSGKPLAILARRSRWQAWDRERQAVVFADGRGLARVDAEGTRTLADLSMLGIPQARDVGFLQALPGGHVGVFARRTLLIVGSDGRIFARTRFQSSADGVVMSPAGDAVAYVNTRLSPRTLRRRVAVLLLPRGARRAIVLRSVLTVRAGKGWEQTSPGTGLGFFTGRATAMWPPSIRGQGVW